MKLIIDFQSSDNNIESLEKKFTETLKKKKIVATIENIEEDKNYHKSSPYAAYLFSITFVGSPIELLKLYARWIDTDVNKIDVADMKDFIQTLED